MKRPTYTRGLSTLLVTGAVIYVVLFSGLSIARYEAFDVATLDLGIMWRRRPRTRPTGACSRRPWDGPRTQG